MSKKQEPEDSGSKLICENRKARFNYEILDTFEAGIVLTGAEIKSVRDGGVSIAESFVRPDSSEMVILQMHIKPYAYNTVPGYEPERKRKLLLHKSEISKLKGSVERKGLTIVPLKVYLKRGYAKVLIGLAKGKASPDKRESIKRREGNREAARAMKRGL